MIQFCEKRLGIPSTTSRRSNALGINRTWPMKLKPGHSHLNKDATFVKEVLTSPNNKLANIVLYSEKLMISLRNSIGRNGIIFPSMGTPEITAIAIMVTIGVNQGQSNPAIGFSAKLSKETYLGDEQTVKYDQVLTNFGNGYDKLCGHFKAPLKGLYVFSCTVMAVGTGDISVVLMKNDQMMSYAYSSTASYDSGAITILLDLQKRDIVWVKRRNEHGRALCRQYNWFTGYLVSTMT